MTEASDQQTAPETDPKPLTEAEGVDSIADLLGDVDLDNPDPKAAKDDKEPKASKEADPLGPDDEEEDVDTGNDTEDADGSLKATAGKYVSPQAKFKLADGTEITVAELARNNLYQRDYSKKTAEVARERETITKEKAEVVQLSQQLRDERQFTLWFAQTFVPQPPQRPALPAEQDPMGHMRYRDEVDRYNAMVNSFQQFKAAQDADQKRQGEMTTKEANERATREIGALYQRLKLDPQKDGAKANAFFQKLSEGAREFYDLDEQTIANATKQDHRFVLILRDAIRARQNKKAAPEVEKTLKTLPRMTRQPTARQAPNQRQEQARTATRERLQRSGSMNDGAAAIEALLSQA